MEGDGKPKPPFLLKELEVRAEIETALPDLKQAILEVRRRSKSSGRFRTYQAPEIINRPEQRHGLKGESTGRAAVMSRADKRKGGISKFGK
jgi:hypothetical protein